MAHPRLEDNMQELMRSLERLAVQRQLPLRQHRERRVLKPGGGTAVAASGPVLLYNPHSLGRDSAASGSLAAGGNVRTPAVAGVDATAALVTQHVGSAAATGPLPTSPALRTYNYVSSAGNGRDPYSRPLSAKDLMTAGLPERVPSRAGNATANTEQHLHSVAAVHPYHAAQPAVPFNTFMHPRGGSPLSTASPAESAQARQHVARSVAMLPAAASASQPAILPSPGVVRIGDSRPPSAAITGTKADEKASGVLQQGTAAAREKFEATLLLRTAELSPSQGQQRVASARPPTAIVRPLSAVRNPHYTPGRPAGSEGLAHPGTATATACLPEQVAAPSSQSVMTYTSGSSGSTGTLSLTAESAKGAAPPTGMTAHVAGCSAQSADACDSGYFTTSAPNGGDCSNGGGSDGSSNGVGGSSGTSGSGISASVCSSSVAGASYYRISSKPETRVAHHSRASGDGVNASSQPSSEVFQLVKGAASIERSALRSKNLKSTPPSVSSSRDHYYDESEAEEDDAGDGRASFSDRTPGDGEAFDDEDDGIDCLDDDEIEGSDDDDDKEQDESGVGSSGGMRSRAASASAAGRWRHQVHTIRMKSATLGTQHQYDDEDYRSPALGAGDHVHPALTKSLFSNVPPYINFVGEDERVEVLPWEFRKLLRWRMCTITPNIVKRAIERSGFRTTKKHYDWLGCWGKHMKATGFKSVREYQKLNHFPGSFQIGRKDRLWKNLLKMQVQFGKKEYNFFPQTFVLPADMRQLQRAWEDCGSKQKWIVKPPASARGIGIKVIGKWSQIPKRRPVIVQKYLCRPYLINESKFDLRIYVYVPSYDPLRIYVFEDGLVRFASSKYSHSMKSINNKYMHLTNFSVNKKNTEYQSNSDDAVCQGHKWSLKSLWGYLQKKGVNTATLWKSMKDVIVKTIISSEAPINSCIKANVRSRYSVHELFGFDILLDEELRPWVLEVNISPSLHSSSRLDVNVKGAMIKDLHNMAGFRIPDKNDVVPSPGSDSYKSGPPANPYCMDKRLHASSLTADERAKHAYYCQRYNEDVDISGITDLLTPDDLRILIESIDEDCHKGGFQRVFPTSSSHVYLKFFEAPRYYNLLLDQWCQQFHRNESKGVSIIEMACLRGVHLQNPTYDPLYQWCPPSARTVASTSYVAAVSVGAANAQLPTLRKKSSGDAAPSASSAALVARPPVSPLKKPPVATS